MSAALFCLDLSLSLSLSPFVWRDGERMQARRCRCSKGGGGGRSRQGARREKEGGESERKREGPAWPNLHFFCLLVQSPLRARARADPSPPGFPHTQTRHGCFHPGRGRVHRLSAVAAGDLVSEEEERGAGWARRAVLAVRLPPHFTSPPLPPCLVVIITRAHAPSPLSLSLTQTPAPRTQSTLTPQG